MFVKLLLALVALQVLLVNADPDPTAPGPGDKCHEGQMCVVAWDTDQSFTWQNMNITLMTGDNYKMVELGVVNNHSIDATVEDKYAFKTPQVYPHSAIYFLQFTSPDSEEKYWTTRFLITDDGGSSTPPTESTQPTGEKIPWGTGMLVNATNPLPPSNTSSSSLPASSGSSSAHSPASTPSVGSQVSGGGSDRDVTVVLSKALVFAISLSVALL